jgi:3-oxoacyl-[acyl-carrier protein] reductase
VAGLDGRVAFVTGSARGIGAATAKRLAADGAKVAVVDLEEAACKDTVEAIGSVGGTAIPIGCDVTKPDQVEAAVARTVEELGWLDVLVNNAGLIRDNLLFKMSDDDWGLVIDTHLRGSFNCARQAQRHMVERRWGRIVNLSSTSALGNRGQTNYSTAKAGLQGMTKTLAIELGPFNINVNAVAPGFIETDMTRTTAARVGIDFENFKQAAATQIPLRRTGRPEEVAGVISFLCGEDASYVSGQVIYVAGGPRA